MNHILCGQARFTFITPRLLRLEWAGDHQFEDRLTLAVCNRDTPPVHYEVLSSSEDGCELRTEFLTLRYQADGQPLGENNLSVSFSVNGATVTWHPGQEDRGNLGGTMRTLDDLDGDLKRVYDHHKKEHTGEVNRRALPPGLLSRDGWTVFDDSASVVLDPALIDPAMPDQPWPTPRAAGQRQDLYLFAYGHDYRAALHDAQIIFGHQPLVPRYALGYWYSRYFAYFDKDIEHLVEQFARNDVPLDMVVIDMDWHRIGWGGYSWDENYFPDAPALLQWLKRRGVHTALNLHPADGVGQHEDAYQAMLADLGPEKVAELRERRPMQESFKERYLRFHEQDGGTFEHIPFGLFDPAFMAAYFQHLHRPLEREGVDVWWMDWQQGDTSEIPGLDTLPWLNHLHWQDQLNNPDRKGKRPLNFSRYGGLGAGRYPVGFSGDTHITWRSLAFQPHFTATAGNVLFGMWSHDIGGFMEGHNTPELYTRWLQFGAYSPMLRTHGTKAEHGGAERRIFTYPEPFCDLMLDAVHLRYSLVPYIYAALRQATESGVSLMRPMYLDHPEADAAYEAKGQYYFGDDLIVAPVSKPVCTEREEALMRVWLPPGQWIDTAHGRMLEGDCWHEAGYRLDEIPVFAKAGAVIPGQGRCHRLEPGAYRNPVFTIYSGADGSGTLYEDDGETEAWREGASARITLRHHQAANTRHIILDPAEGDYGGFVDARRLTLRLPGMLPPQRVHLDGTDVPWQDDLAVAATAAWRWDADCCGVIIQIPDYHARQGIKCEITLNPDLSAAGLDGLPALFRRLGDYGRRVARISPVHAVVADERFPVYVAQTGNRIRRRPHTAAEELRALPENLRQLIPCLSHYRQELLKRDSTRPHHGAQVLAEVERLAQQAITDFQGTAIPQQGLR